MIVRVQWTFFWHSLNKFLIAVQVRCNVKCHTDREVPRVINVFNMDENNLPALDMKKLVKKKVYF